MDEKTSNTIPDTGVGNVRRGVSHQPCIEQPPQYQLDAETVYVICTLITNLCIMQGVKNHREALLLVGPAGFTVPFMAGLELALAYPALMASLVLPTIDPLDSSESLKVNRIESWVTVATCVDQLAAIANTPGDNTAKAQVMVDSIETLLSGPPITEQAREWEKQQRGLKGSLSNPTDILKKLSELAKQSNGKVVNIDDYR